MPSFISKYYTGFTLNLKVLSTEASEELHVYNQSFYPAEKCIEELTHPQNII